MACPQCEGDEMERIGEVRSRSRGRTTRMGRGRSDVSKVITIVLAVEDLVRTDGTQTYVGQIAENEQFRHLGPLIYRMRVHWESENATTNFRGKVTMAWSVSGKVWSTPVDLHAAVAGSGQSIQA